MSYRPAAALVAAAPIALLALGACIHKRGVVEVVPVETTLQPVQVTTPVKAHLSNGSVVVFPSGVVLSGDTLRGSGTRYGPELMSADEISAVALDDLVGLESFQQTEETMQGLTALTTVVMIGAGAFAAVAGSMAIFGSCPTVYAHSPDTDGGFVLEAEAFSYSIAPLLEARDVDVLGAAAAPGGVLELELRNEALETHYLNHVELLEVTHTATETVLPDELGRPLVLGPLQPLRSARDRSGRDVTAALRAAGDDVVYGTADEVVRSASAEDPWDHVELTFPRPDGADRAALAFRMRNSLLNTLLFYDFMLGSGGIHAVDWLGGDLETIGSAVELGRWYRSRFGLRVEVADESGYREVARVGDSGPIAWKEVAVVVPVPAGDGPLRIRISSMADEWRIDRVSLASEVRGEPGRIVPLEEIRDRDGARDLRAMAGLGQPDETYHVTGPGYRGTLRFRAGTVPADGRRTFLLASQGYYTEWIRPAWIRSATRSEPFAPGDTVLEELLVEWRAVKHEMEERFYATRIPVR